MRWRRTETRWHNMSSLRPGRVRRRRNRLLRYRRKRLTIRWCCYLHSSLIPPSRSRTTTKKDGVRKHDCVRRYDGLPCFPLSGLRNAAGARHYVGRMGRLFCVLGDACTDTRHHEYSIRFSNRQSASACLFLFLLPSSYSSPFASSFLPIHHHRGRYPFRTARWSTRRVPSLIPSSVFRAVHQNVARAKPRTPVSVLA